MKHALLALILAHLRRKEAAFRVIDTHAGIGLYDLCGPEAARTGEWRDGIGRLDAAFSEPVEQALGPYRDVLARVRERHGVSAYPGSPAITRELLRPQDRAVFVEKHPQDEALLAARFNVVRNTKVLGLDGWTALGSLIPPKERRGLVLIDPPYEEAGEMAAAARRLARAVRKWPTGIFALWYPIKSSRACDELAAALAASQDRPALRLELGVEAPAEAGRLAGSGLVVLNPPWTLGRDAAVLLPALAERLGRSGRGWSRTGPLLSASENM